MNSDATSPQTLAMLELLGDSDSFGSQHEADKKVYEMSGEQRSLFKTVASCMAQGMGPEAVAKFIGDDDVSKVRMLFKHSMVLEELKNLSLTEGAIQAFENVLAGSQMDSLFRLIQLRDTAKSETVQYNSATKIIDLAMKNPTADLDDLPTDAKMRAEELQRRIDKLSRNLK